MERVKRLEESGLIRGYHARLDRSKSGFPITAFVAIRYPVTEHAGDEPQIQALAANPNVLECHHVAGEDCYMLKVAAPSIESLEGVLRQIKQPGHPVSTRTTIVLSTLFEKPGIVPVEDD
jgi:Lrp/AsnC family leucine-responsive transcriptional regulator